MKHGNLLPLSSVISVPLELRFGTIEKFARSASMPATAGSTATGVEGWLMKLQQALPDKRVHVHARVHPAQTKGPDDVLQLQGLRRAVISSVALLAAPVPYARRGLLDAVFRVERNGQQINCSVRVTPTNLRYFGRRALARLDLTAEASEAAKNMSVFWGERLTWLKRSGILALEVRANLQFLAWS